MQHEAARTLRNARMHAELQSEWGTVSTCPSNSLITKYGCPIVLTTEKAFLYAPKGKGVCPYGDQEDIEPTIMDTEEAWNQTYPTHFTFIHFFSGPIPEQFEGIHEALDFSNRCGAVNGADIVALKSVMDMGSRRNDL